MLIFLKLKKTPGKVRNRSETPKRQHLPSIHPSTSSLIIATSIITSTTSTSTTTSTTTATTTTSTSTSISSTSNHFTLTITNSVSRLAPRAAFF